MFTFNKQTTLCSLLNFIFISTSVPSVEQWKLTLNWEVQEGFLRIASMCALYIPVYDWQGLSILTIQPDLLTVTSSVKSVQWLAETPDYDQWDRNTSQAHTAYFPSCLPAVCLFRANKCLTACPYRITALQDWQSKRSIWNVWKK